MKELLNAIRTQLRTDLTYVRNRDVYVTEDEILIPDYVKFPAVALKDGTTARKLADKSEIDEDLRVRISSYSQIFKPEESVMGSKGVLQMTADIINSLDENNLSLAGMYHAFAISVEASETFGDEQEMIQKKTVVFQYQRTKPRS